MKHSSVHISDLAAVSYRHPSFVAIGSFDGVHLGHQAVIRQMVAAAREQGTRAVVLTFYPHPQIVLRDLKGPFYLTTLEQRITLLSSLGVDLVISHTFDNEVRNTRAADFVKQLLEHIDVRQFWGSEFGLGYQREGDASFLRRMGEDHGFTVQVVDGQVRWSGEPVSSSRIRASLARGDVVDAAGCLGRPYRLGGEVVVGDRRGRTLGYPTANLETWSRQIVPADGVYTTYAWLDGERHAAAANIGIRPTVNGRQRVIEAHLLDFDRDVYGAELQLDFVERLRDEMKFPDISALAKQIGADVASARRLLLPD